MKLSNRIFADFLEVSEVDIYQVNNFLNEYEVILTDKSKHFVGKLDLIIFSYDKILKYEKML